MARKKVIDTTKNGIGGIDLIVEKDAGNAVRVLTGNQSLDFWKRMSTFSLSAIEQIKKNKKEGIYNGT